MFLKVNSMITLFDLNNDILILFMCYKIMCDEGKLFREKTNHYTALCQTVKDQGLNCQYIPVVWVKG